MTLVEGGLLESDLDEILLKLAPSWSAFRNSTILILGGSGFIGTWLVSAILNADRKLSLGIQIIVVSRDVSSARNRLNLTDINTVTFIEFDLMSDEAFIFPEADYIIHAATPSIPATGSNEGFGKRNSTNEGVKRILKALQRNNFAPKILYTSSGAVYGLSKGNTVQFKESDTSEPLCERTAYGAVKLSSEKLLEEIAEDYSLLISNPRLFTFMGPHLSLNEHFAIGNFLQDGLSNRSIHVNGNPESIRSYMYPTDLVVWLIRILENPLSQPLNVGSEKNLTMGELGAVISNMTSRKDLILLNPAQEINCYWPSTLNTRKHYKVDETVSLEEGLRRWIHWLRIKN
jgi:nucleoside-diphosphate-sugar epimerase